MTYTLFLYLCFSVSFVGFILLIFTLLESIINQNDYGGGGYFAFALFIIFGFIGYALL